MSTAKKNLKIMTVVGTRPELIKLSRVIARLDEFTEHILVHTGQNFSPELSDIFFSDLGIRKPDVQMQVADATTMGAIGKVLTGVDSVLSEVKPNALLIYGDTNSCLAAYAAKRRWIPVFHMEAGNRCWDERAPEEVNRRLLDHISDVNMPLTENARRILLSEGLPEDCTIKIGSTMPEVIVHQLKRMHSTSIISDLGLRPNKYIIASLHREENVDSPENLRRLILNLNQITVQFNLPLVLSLHPRTRLRLEKESLPLHPSIQAMRPFCFSEYLALQKSAFCVLSDSGTLTEEAAILGFPAVMLRDAHERPEGMEAGVAAMAGACSKLLIDAIAFVTAMHGRGERNSVYDYQHLNVSDKIVNIILSYTPYIMRRKFLTGQAL